MNVTELIVSTQAEVTTRQKGTRTKRVVFHPDLKKVKNQAFSNVIKDLSSDCVIKSIEVTEAVEATSVKPRRFPSWLLEALNIPSLYSHQLEAYDILQDGKSIILATPTSSGKTNGYFSSIIKDCIEKKTTAFLVYPLKGLILDQYEKLIELNSRLKTPLNIVRIDGDVTSEQRKEMFNGEHPDIICINPDVLHHFLSRISGKNVLENWRIFLSKLEYVVVDEAHTYRSSFGGHFANLIKRLKLCVNNCNGDESSIKYVVSTATIGNAKQLASQLTGKREDQLHLIDKSGAYESEKTFVAVEPLIKTSYLTADCVYSCVRSGLKSLVFVNSRNSAKYLANLLENQFPLKGKVAIFYGTLPKAKREQIKHDLSQGKLRCVITTNALEAGIDLPNLDVVILKGFAGALMYHNQRKGRAGRSTTPGMTIFIPSESDPLDYFYGSDPQRLKGDIENVIINPSYPSIVQKHLVCVAKELGGLTSQILSEFDNGAELADLLYKQGKLFKNSEGIYFANGYPHRSVNLRGNDQSQITLYDADTEEEIESFSLAQGFREIHLGAIYATQEDGKLVKWRVTEFDLNSLTAKAQKIDYDHFTEPSAYIYVSPIRISGMPRILSLKGGNLRLTLFDLANISYEVAGYNEYSRTYRLSCAQETCLAHKMTLVDSHCPYCHKQTKRIEVTELVDQIEFEEKLTSRYQAPAFQIETNSGVSESIKQIAELFKQALLEHHGSLNAVPNEFKELFVGQPIQMAIHALTHLLIKAIPRFMLGTSQDANSLVSTSGGDKGKAYIFDVVDGGNGSSETIANEFDKISQLALELAFSCDCQSKGCPKCLYLGHCPERNESINKLLGMSLLEQIVNQPKEQQKLSD